MNILRLVLLGLALASPTLALAAPPAEVRRACGADARRLCGPVLFKESARRACMRKHRAELSATCRAATNRWRDQARAKCRARYSGPQIRDCVLKAMGLPRGG